MPNKLIRSIERKPIWPWAATIVVIAIACGYFGWWYLSVPPKLATSEEAIKTVDAMFTALTARDTNKLASCMKRVEAFANSGEISTGALTQLRGCERLAAAGQWEQAAQKLYWIVYDQPR